MASLDNLEERVIEIVARELGVEKEKITLKANFINDLGADSLDQVELLMQLEEEFGVNIPDEVAEKMLTVGEALDYIKKNYGG